ncbi:alpha/beta fold hydrolase [Cohnella sp. GCM10027633]|uniref:alpha/beta fold hydrolase n=1 Tax=unclassified Cohnella TaxID=2636738 RepID=UPI00363F5790
MNTTKSKDGTTLAYDVYGSGPALLYITGASCFRSFKPIVQDAKVLAGSFTVYNYDRRGRGDSGNTLPYSLEREIEDIEAMIDAAGGTAYVYGHSSGAVLALEAALRLGGKVRKVALYDASYVHDEQERTEYRRLSLAVHKLLDAGDNAEAMRTFLKGIGMPRAFVWLLPLIPGWRKMKALAPTLAYDIALTQDLAPVDRAAALAVPALIGVGEKSPAGLQDVARQLAEAIPGAKYARLTGQNHMVSAKKLLPLLSDFFG